MPPDPIRSISVVIPVFQEEANLAALCEQLWPVLGSLTLDVEVIFVDDGSTDGSFKILREIADTRAGVRVISFRRNAGQTAAMQAGIDAASHEVIVPLDADLQNDPADIPRLLDKLNQGWDVVSGWRKQRSDAAVRRVEKGCKLGFVVSLRPPVNMDLFAWGLRGEEWHESFEILWLW